MKTLIFIVIAIIILVISGCIYYSECSETDFDIETTVAIDRSGSHAYALPSKETIRQAFSENKELWEGYAFNAVSLSDVHLNKVYSAKIEPECSFTGNVYQRKKNMENFSREVDSAIDQLLAEPMDRPYSSVYLAIARELNRLSGSKAKKKRLIVYSDLIEQSALFNLYDKKTFSQLRQNPDSIASRLNKEMELQTLYGIEIYLIYPPLNISDSEQYRIVSDFYKLLFEKNGAKVFIGANLIL